MFSLFLIYIFKILVLHLTEYHIEILLSSPLVATKSVHYAEETSVINTLMLQETSWGRINVAERIFLTKENFVNLGTKMHHAKFNSLKMRFWILFMMRLTWWVKLMIVINQVFWWIYYLVRNKEYWKMIHFYLCCFGYRYFYYSKSK